MTDELHNEQGKQILYFARLLYVIDPQEHKNCKSGDKGLLSNLQDTLYSKVLCLLKKISDLESSQATLSAQIEYLKYENGFCSGNFQRNENFGSCLICQKITISSIAEAASVNATLAIYRRSFERIRKFVDSIKESSSRPKEQALGNTAEHRGTISLWKKHRATILSGTKNLHSKIISSEKIMSTISRPSLVSIFNMLSSKNELPNHFLHEFDSFCTKIIKAKTNIGPEFVSICKNLRFCYLENIQLKVELEKQSAREPSVKDVQFPILLLLQSLLNVEPENTGRSPGIDELIYLKVRGILSSLELAQKCNKSLAGEIEKRDTYVAKLATHLN